jgi:hypothetical protein
VRLALRLRVVLLSFLLPFLLLFLVIVIIGTLCFKMTRLNTLEARALSPLFVLVEILLASLQGGLEMLDDERDFFFIEPDGLHLCYLAR